MIKRSRRFNPNSTNLNVSSQVTSQTKRHITVVLNCSFTFVGCQMMSLLIFHISYSNSSLFSFLCYPHLRHFLSANDMWQERNNNNDKTFYNFLTIICGLCEYFLGYLQHLLFANIRKIIISPFSLLSHKEDKKIMKSCY